MLTYYNLWAVSLIHVNRDRIQIPSVLGPDPNCPGKIELKDAAKFYKICEDRRRQQRFQFKVYKHPSVKQALMELFSGKCAYCDSKIDVIDFARARRDLCYQI